MTYFTPENLQKRTITQYSVIVILFSNAATSEIREILDSVPSK